MTEEKDETYIDVDIQEIFNNTINTNNKYLLNNNATVPLIHDVIKSQATINLLISGHVSHGKSSICRAITGIQTQKFKKEKERNITIKLGYANAKIFMCMICPRPQCYQSFSSSKQDNPICCNTPCTSPMKLVRHISFSDAPGHEILMGILLTFFVMNKVVKMTTVKLI